LIRVHGGRQEIQAKGGTWSGKEKPNLEKTHGCIRAFDKDVKKLKQITDALTNIDPSDKPGMLKVSNSIPKKDTPVLKDRNND